VIVGKINDIPRGMGTIVAGAEALRRLDP
jgi:hypothetical protein